MEKHLLSKSTFIRGNQCLKSLYLNKKRPFLRDKMPKERLIIFQRGHKVGELAQDLFPGGLNMSPGHPAAFRKALINTTDNIEKGVPVIYEAAFQYDQVLIFLDILVRTEDGWHAYEVKSSGGISDTYLMDAALQYFVMKGSGIKLTGISIIHIDKEYILQDELEKEKLFKTVDVTAEALSRQDYVKDQILKEKDALSLAHSPKIAVGDHCRLPYDCDFIGHCWKNEPVPPKKELAEQLNHVEFRQWDLGNKNLYFMKLMSMRPAVPMYRGSSPYGEVIYGYSIYDSSTEQFQSEMGAHTANPEPAMNDSIQKVLPADAKIICFGQGFLIKDRFKQYEVLDLQDLLFNDSDFYTQMKDKGALERLRTLFGFDKQIDLPEYSSDAIAEHYYLKEFEDDAVKQKILNYADTWTQMGHLVYQELLNA